MVKLKRKTVVTIVILAVIIAVFGVTYYIVLSAPPSKMCTLAAFKTIMKNMQVTI